MSEKGPKWGAGGGRQGKNRQKPKRKQKQKQKSILKNLKDISPKSRMAQKGSIQRTKRELSDVKNMES